MLLRWFFRSLVIDFIYGTLVKMLDNILLDFTVVKISMQDSINALMGV
jgi:hypothetical protein